MSSFSSSETSGIRCEPMVFIKNTFQTISHRNSAKYSYPHLALLSSTCYPEEKAILNAARASAKRPQPTNLQLGDSLYFTDFKFFSVLNSVVLLFDSFISLRSPNYSTDQ